MARGEAFLLYSSKKIISNCVLRWCGLKRDTADTTGRSIGAGRSTGLANKSAYMRSRPNSRHTLGHHRAYGAPTSGDERRTSTRVRECSPAAGCWLGCMWSGPRLIRWNKKKKAPSGHRSPPLLLLLLLLGVVVGLLLRELRLRRRAVGVRAELGALALGRHLLADGVVAARVVPLRLQLGPEV